MTGPLPLPLRVLMKGGSTVHTVSYMGGPRSDFAYPRATEAELYAAGVPAEVRCTAMASQRTKEAFKTWEQETFSWSPDVVVLTYGYMEIIHLFLPQPLERHANSLAARPGLVRTPYRTALHKFWKLLARLQQRLDRRLPRLFMRRRLRAASDMFQLVERIQMIGSPLVLIMELTPPGPPFRKWFPGLAERMDLTNEALRDVVRRTDLPNVRFFPTNTVLAPLMAVGEVVPDGGHYTPEAHRVIAAALAEEILEWARQEGLVGEDLPTDLPRESSAS
jgi:lysophospholipase L1-like esterase